MTDLLLRRIEARAGAERSDDYDVIGPDGLVIGRIFKATTAPAETPWMWTLTREEREDHGHESTREAPMQAFAEMRVAGAVPLPLREWERVRVCDVRGRAS